MSHGQNLSSASEPELVEQYCNSLKFQSQQECGKTFDLENKMKSSQSTSIQMDHDNISVILKSLEAGKIPF
jgi:hypothetical protein